MEATTIARPEPEAEPCLRNEEEAWRHRCCPEIVGESPALLAALEVVRRVARDGDCTVLLTGETGTGKELVSRAIHHHGRRRRFPFRAVNCASLSPDLAESLLFGHRRGAFTDATTASQGLFRESDGGTVFLDEVQELDPRVQAKLLRFLQDREVVPLGGGERCCVDVRIIAGSNRDLEGAVAEGLFRADLFYRLQVVPVHLPPLRERKEDIPLLVDHFLKRLNGDKGCHAALDPDVMGGLTAHDWPGNVRELRNLVERLVILFGNRVVRREDLATAGLVQRTVAEPPQRERETVHQEATTKMVTAFERDFLQEQLTAHGWNITRTAKSIGRSRQWLSQRIHRYHLGSAACA